MCLGYTKDINVVDDASFSIKKGDFVSTVTPGPALLFARKKFDGMYYGIQMSSVRLSVRRKHVAPQLENGLS